MGMLGTPINKKLYDLINKTVIINHPQDGPIEVEVNDIKGGMVLFESTIGVVQSMPVEEFEKLASRPKC